MNRKIEWIINNGLSFYLISVIGLIFTVWLAFNDFRYGEFLLWTTRFFFGFWALVWVVGVASLSMTRKISE